MQSVILAGGLGTRLYPITQRNPQGIGTDPRQAICRLSTGLAGAARASTRWFIASAIEAGRSWTSSATAVRGACRVRYVDEGEDLRGTAGALRLALETHPWTTPSSSSTAIPSCPSTTRRSSRSTRGREARADDRAAQRESLGPQQRHLRATAGRALRQELRRGHASHDDHIDYGLLVISRRLVADEIRARCRGRPCRCSASVEPPGRISPASK